jgi:hypothetical protein
MSERPETPPNPSANIPFPRDLDFVNRGTLLDQIYEKLSVPASRAALVGLGGVGYNSKAWSLIPSADLRAGSRSLQLNTRTKSEINRKTHGFSGYTEATPPVLSKVFGKLQT